jgi:hypothetical protein
LPNHRTRELDALAMLDEGGVLALEAPEARLLLIFGHAIYEGLVLTGAQMTGRMVQLPVAALAPAPLAQADTALAALLRDPTSVSHPDQLPRVFVPWG